MAGVDKDFVGEAKPADGIRDRLPAAGAAARRQQDVLGNVEEAVAKTTQLLKRFDEVNAKLGEPIDARRRWTSCSRSRASCRTRSTRPTPGSSTARSRSPWTRCACRPGDADVDKLSGGERRRVALCRMLLEKPDMLLLDEPTNHLDAESVAWLEQLLHEYPGTVVAVTHDRYFLDNVAGWILELDRGAGHPVEGQLLVLARAEGQAARARGEDRSRRGSGRSRASSSGCAPRPAPGRPSRRRASPPTTKLLAEEQQKRAGRHRDPHPHRAAPRRRGGRGRAPAQGLRRQPPHRGSQLPTCRAAASSASSAPTAPARRRSSG